jgi:aspartate/glutamate racemase
MDMSDERAQTTRIDGKNGGCTGAGVIGCGWRAAMWYYGTLQSLNDQLLPAQHVAISIHGTAFPAIDALLPDDLESAGRLLKPYIECAERSDSRNYILANITLHEAVDRLGDEIGTTGKFLHLREVIAARWQTSGTSSMIVGSAHTMRSGYLRSLFHGSGVRNWVEADCADLEHIDRTRKQVYSGELAPAEASEEIASIFARYPEVDRFIIACTEHSLALGHSSNQRVFDLGFEQCKHLLHRVATSDKSAAVRLTTPPQSSPLR